MGPHKSKGPKLGEILAFVCVIGNERQTPERGNSVDGR